MTFDPLNLNIAHVKVEEREMSITTDDFMLDEVHGVEVHRV